MKTPEKAAAIAVDVEVSAEDLARIEAATQAKETKEGGLRYEVVLSPAVKKGPKISPPSSPLTSQELAKKHKEAEERRQQLDALRSSVQYDFFALAYTLDIRKYICLINNSPVSVTYQ
jgi:hypothetical protein